MRDWQFDGMINVPREETGAIEYRECYPATLELCRGVVGQAGKWLFTDCISEAGKQASAHQGLKAVADAQHRPALVNELAQLRPQVDGQVFCQQGTRSQVVAIGEAARNNQKVKVEQALRLRDKLVDMQEVRFKFGQATGMSRFAITVDAGST
jgi:hypothetical protein